MIYEKDSSVSLLLPVLVMSFTLAGVLGAQSWMLVSDRSMLNEAYVKQTDVLTQIDKSKTQVNDLIKGVVALAKQDDKNAQGIIDELKKAGINFQDAPKQGAIPPAPPAPPPSATMKGPATPPAK
jgi:hypothetical protein